MGFCVILYSRACVCTHRLYGSVVSYRILTLNVDPGCLTCAAILKTSAKKIGFSVLGEKSLISSQARKGPLDFQSAAIGRAAVGFVPVLSLSNI